jgi:hypothetical protein
MLLKSHGDDSNAGSTPEVSHPKEEWIISYSEPCNDPDPTLERPGNFQPCPTRPLYKPGVWPVSLVTAQP